MDRPTIEAQKRPDLGTRSAQRLRRDGLVPAVLYGHKQETIHLTLGLTDVDHLLHDGARVVDLQIGGVVETALLKDIQYDAMGDHVLHLDLNRIDADERVQVTVPVVLHGLCRGVESGGILDHLLQDIEVECSAVSIPDNVRVEVADLDIGDGVHIRDLEAPAGLTFLQDPDSLVVTVHPPVAAAAEEELAEEVAEGAAAEPELIGQRDKEGDQAEDDQ